jgi:ribosome-associated protein
MTPDSPLALSHARMLAEAALDRKALDVVLLEVTGLTSFADAFVICSGTSDRHVRAVADAVIERSKALGERPLGVEGYEGGRWVLIDLNDVLVHVFQRDARDHYDLERLWADAPVTVFSEPEGEPPARRQAP